MNFLHLRTQCTRAREIYEVQNDLVHNARFTSFGQDETWYIGRRLTHPCGFRRVRRLREFSEKIAAVQKLGPVVKRELARVVRNDAAGVDDHGLNISTLAVFTPPPSVIPDRVLFRDARLTPPVCAPVPWLRRNCIPDLSSRQSRSTNRCSQAGVPLQKAPAGNITFRIQG
jgi:hypothetical protein